MDDARSLLFDLPGFRVVSCVPARLLRHVRTWAEHAAVVAAALMARGVIDVRDNLQVTRLTPPAGARC